MYVKYSIDKTIDNTDIELITDIANINTDVKIDINRLNRLDKVINNTNSELNTVKLDRASKIIEKKLRMYKSNLF